MNRSFRFARFCTSVLFLAAALFLAALWFGSYWRSDSLVAHLSGTNSAYIHSDAGQMDIAIVPRSLHWSLDSKTKSAGIGATAQSSGTGPVTRVLPWGPMI